MYTNNSANGEAMWRRLVAANGLQYFSLPVNNQMGAHMIGVPTGNDRVTIINTATNDVYQTTPSVIGNIHNAVQNPNQMTQRPVNNFLTNQGGRRGEYNESADSGILSGGVIQVGMPTMQAMSMNASPGYETRFTHPYSRWTVTNVSEGLRIIPAAAMQQFAEPATPTKFDADPDFNDALYMSLQGDIRPKGANPVDDYLNDHGAARLKLYKELVLGRQDCQCECQRTELDQYLHKNQDVNSAIGLRATLSDDCRHRLQEPKNTKPVIDKLEILKAQATELLRWVSEYSGNTNAVQQHPMDIDNGDDSLLIG